MNWVDIVIIVLAVVLGFLGWKNGVIKFAFTLVGGLIGIIVAGRLYDQLAPSLPIGNETMARVAAFAIILLVIMVAAWVAARLLKSVLNLLLLGWVDHVAGAAIGVVIAGLILTVLLSAAGTIPSDTTQDSIEDSALADPVISSMQFVYALLPREFDAVRDLVSSGTDLIDRGTDFLEESDRLQGIVEGGQDLLEQAGGLADLVDRAQEMIGSDEELDLVVAFEGFSGMGNETLLAVFEPEEGDTLGPVEGNVLDSGGAVLAVGGIDAEASYTMYYYVDANGNGECDADTDAVGSEPVPAGTSELEVTHSGGGELGVCANFE